MIFQSIFLLLLCYFRSLLATSWANIQESFYSGFIVIASYTYIPDFLKKLFIKWGLDLNLGQILFGYQYMGPNINYKDFSGTTDTTQGSNISTGATNTTQGSSTTVVGTSTTQDSNVTATVSTVEDSRVTVDIIRSSIPSGDIENIYPTAMRKEADYAYFWTIPKRLEFYAGVNENYNNYKTFYPEDKLKAYDTCLYKLKQTNRRALLYYDDLSVIKYMSNAGLLSDDLRSKLAGLGNDEPIAFRHGVFGWLRGSLKQLIEELTSKRSEFIKQINLNTSIPEEAIAGPSTGNVSERTIAGPNTGNVSEGTIAGPSKRANPMDISNIISNPSNTNSPILSQIDSQVWQTSNSDSELETNRPNKRPRILEEDPTGNRKGKEKES